MNTRPLFRRGFWGISLGRDLLRPSWIFLPDDWHAQAFGIAVWRNARPPETVGERGAW